MKKQIVSLVDMLEKITAINESNVMMVLNLR